MAEILSVNIERKIDMSKHLIVLGGGPGGYAAALVAAQKGLKVTLIEEREIGGTCLNRGCIPTKALLACSDLYSRIREATKYGIRVEGASADLDAMQTRKEKVVKTLRTGVESLLAKRGVTVVKARGRFVGSHELIAGTEHIKGDYIIIATGTEALRLWEGDGILTSDEALALKEVPESLLVVGAGAVGIEMACFYSELGSKVTVVEMMAQAMPGLDSDIVETCMRELKKKGIQIKTGCKVEKLEGRTVTFSDGKSASYAAILQAVGRAYNTGDIGLEQAGLTALRGRITTSKTMETGVAGIYAIGDIVADSPLLAHSATAQGIVAALSAAGEKASMDYTAIPNCIYSHPEVASVGVREIDLNQPLVAKVPYRAIGRSHAGGDISGLMKIVAEQETGKVRGVHIVGERATELIHEGAAVVRLGLTVHEMGEMVRAHPTFSELYSECYHFLEGRAIHVV